MSTNQSINKRCLGREKDGFRCNIGLITMDYCPYHTKQNPNYEAEYKRMMEKKWSEISIKEERKREDDRQKQIDFHKKQLETIERMKNILRNASDTS